MTKFGSCRNFGTAFRHEATRRIGLAALCLPLPPGEKVLKSSIEGR